VIGRDDEVGLAQNPSGAICRDDLAQVTIVVLHERSHHALWLLSKVPENIRFAQVHHQDAWVVNAVKGPECVLHRPVVLPAQVPLLDGRSKAALRVWNWVVKGRIVDGARRRTMGAHGLRHPAIVVNQGT